jgi:hypothetical protein
VEEVMATKYTSGDRLIDAHAFNLPGTNIYMTPASGFEGESSRMFQFGEATPTPSNAKSGTKKWYDTPNMINAGVTMFLSGISSLGQTLSMGKMYEYYKRQEDLYLEAAAEQARRIQIRGNILLANLRTKHAITEGKNELAVAGAGAGSISGSFLDKLVTNRKYNTREEYVQGLETTWAVDNAKRQGYIQALDIAGKAAQTAYNTRTNAILGLVKGLQNASSSLLEDKRQEDKHRALKEQMKIYLDSELAKIDARYGKMNNENVVDATYQINESAGESTGLSTGFSGGSVLSSLQEPSLLDTIDFYVSTQE